MPRYCVYAYACPSVGPRQRQVEAYRCLRHDPPEARPEPGLSVVAMEALSRLRRERAAGQAGLRPA